MKIIKVAVYLIFLLLINISIAEICEYDGIIFYPNNTQYINISKLYISGNDSNILQVYIIYKNSTFMIPQFNVNRTFNLPIEKLNLSVFINATKSSENEWDISYSIKNNYNFSIPINVSFPNGYSINNVSIVVPSKSLKTIVLSKYSSSDNLYFENSNISFTIPSKIKIRYSLAIPFSIEKSNRILNNGSEIWYANYSIYNNKDVSLKLNGTTWVVIGNNSFNLGNFSNVLVSPNSSFNLSYGIYSNNVPTFYIKFYDWNEIYRNITIKPALNENGSYIIGLARVMGCNLTGHYYAPNNENSENNINNHKTLNNPENNQNQNNHKSIEAEHITKSTSSTSSNSKPNEINLNTHNNVENSITSPVSKITNSIIERTRKYLLNPYSKESYIMGVKIKKLSNPKYAAAISVPILLINIIIIIPILLLSSACDILDNGYITPEIYRALRRNVNTPYGMELGKIIPINIVASSPNAQLVSEIYESLDIPLNSAKALALAVECGGRLLTSDKKTYEFAKSIGLNVIYVGE